MAQNVTIGGACYNSVPSVKLPKSGTGGGYATFVDTSGDTVAADKLKKGATAYNSAGNLITGTMESGGGNYKIATGYVDKTATATEIAITGLDFKPEGGMLIMQRARSLSSNNYVYLCNATFSVFTASSGSAYYGTAKTTGGSYKRMGYISGANYTIASNSLTFHNNSSNYHFLGGYAYIVWGKEV